MDNLRLAVCVCIIKDAKVLVVARRGTTDDFGLIGGKVEPGEDPIDALVREVIEEYKTKLIKVFERIDQQFNVITYLYNGVVEETPTQGDAGPVAWITWEQLISCHFGEYNAKLKETLGL